MKLVLNSTTHNNCPVAQREKLSLTDEHIKTMLKAMHEKPGINEAAILAVQHNKKEVVQTSPYLFFLPDFSSSVTFKLASPESF